MSSLKLFLPIKQKKSYQVSFSPKTRGLRKKIVLFSTNFSGLKTVSGQDRRNLGDLGNLEQNLEDIFSIVHSSSSICSFSTAFFKCSCCIKPKSYIHHTLSTCQSHQLPKAKLEGKQTYSHICSNNMHINVLCYVDTKLKYLIIAIIYITNSQSPKPHQIFALPETCQNVQQRISP